MNELALFAGAGGGILGGHLLGWRTVCAVERDAYAAQILAQRQNDGILKPFPIWSDVCSFDGKPWKGIVDVISGGFPCQDISVTGKRAGITGERSSLWLEMERIIGEVQPRYVFIENSPNLRGNGLVTVLQGLTKIGYDAAWDVLSARNFGANHERKRMWIIASNTNMPQCEGGWVPGGGAEEYTDAWVESWWATEPNVCRVDDGVAFVVDRLKATGNGQVPIVAATAFNRLSDRLSWSKNE